MRLPLTRSENIALTIIIIHLTLSIWCRLVSLGGYIVNLSTFIVTGNWPLFCRLIGKLTAFLQLQEFSLRNQPGGFFHFHRAVFFSEVKSKCANLLSKAESLRIHLNLDGVSITSKSHTHPSHSQTSRLLTSSLSLGVPVPGWVVSQEEEQKKWPRPTQCMWGV